MISLSNSSLSAGWVGSNALAQASVAMLAGRIVSVLPCLNAEVLQDSYVAGLHLNMR